jgi:WD40 repeat protein
MTNKLGTEAKDPGKGPRESLANLDTLALPTLPAPATGEGYEAPLPVIDPASYTIVGEFARGGYGRVLEAYDRRLNRRVALKELFANHGGAEERFVREALVTARLEHPSIVPIHEVGRWPSGELFYAMKLVSGRALAELIAESRALEQRLALLPHVLAVAEAIAYAHSQRIIHRDLKPHNILVGAFGETLVIDWGLAKDLRAEAERDHHAPPPGPELAGRSALRRGITVDGTVIGTPAYMPPEQALARVVDERADVYALGAILYHVLAGAPPYQGEGPYQVIAKLLVEPPPDLEARERDVPRELVAIVKKAMAREPRDRYPTAQELAHDLRRFQTGQIVGAHTYSWAERARRIARRYRAALMVAVAAFVVLLSAAVAFVQRVREERDRAEQDRDRVELGRVEVESARREAVERADQLTLLQARGARETDPTATLAWLKKLSPAFARWGAARTIAADAKARGVARVLRGHTGPLNDAAISPDGKMLAVVSDDRRASLWDLATSRRRYLEGHVDEVWSAAFSPDGKQLATGSKDTTVRLWDVSTGQARELVGHMSPVWRALFLPDGAHLVSRGRGERVLLWDLASGTGRELEGAAEDLDVALSPDGTMIAWTARSELVLWDVARGKARRWPGQSSPTKRLAYSPDGTHVATADQKGKVRLWAVKDGAVSTLPGPLGLLNALDFSPDGKQLAAGGAGSELVIWDVSTEQRRELRGHEGSLWTVRFSPRGDRIATAGADRTVRLWNLATGGSRILRGFADTLTGVVFSRDGGLLVGVGWDNTARLWDVAAMEDEILTRHEGGAQALAFFRAGRCVASAGRDGVIRVAPLAPRAFGGRADAEPNACGRIGDKSGHEGPIEALVAWSSGDRLASAGQDGTVRLWNIDGGEPTILRGHEGRVAALAVSKDGKWIASGGKDGTVRLWDVERREGRVVLRHEGAVKQVAFSPSGGQIASGGHDGSVRLWDLAAGTPRELRHMGNATLALVFSPDGKVLAAADDRRRVHLWEVESGGARAIDYPTDVSQIAFLPGGEALVTTAREDMAVRVTDMKTFAFRRVLVGQSSEVLDLVLSPDGRRVATARKDGTVELWDMDSEERRVLTGHSDKVVAVAFSPEGRFLLSASADGTVRRFRDDLPSEPAALRAWLSEATADSVERSTEPPGLGSRSE